MFRVITLLVLMLSGCSITHEIEGINKLDALLDGGITIHIDGIPEGGVPVRYVAAPPTENDDDAGK